MNSIRQKNRVLLMLCNDVFILSGIIGEYSMICEACLPALNIQNFLNFSAHQKIKISKPLSSIIVIQTFLNIS
jgi:hypothetical protein